MYDMALIEYSQLQNRSLTKQQRYLYKYIFRITLDGYTLTQDEETLYYYCATDESKQPQNTELT